VGQWDKRHLITYLFQKSNIPSANNLSGQRCTNPDLTLTDNCHVVFHEKSQRPTWLIDLDYKPSSDALLYAKYARGYRAGLIAGAAPSNLAEVGPEKVDAYEVGAKTEFGGPLHPLVNISAFYNDFSDQQVQASLIPKPSASVSPFATVVNAGRSRIWGVEVEFGVRPFTGFTIDASYTYLNARIRKMLLPPKDLTRPRGLGGR
jgi:iron complex outermembrane receptor protein